MHAMCVATRFSILIPSCDTISLYTSFIEIQDACLYFIYGFHSEDVASIFVRNIRKGVQRWDSQHHDTKGSAAWKNCKFLFITIIVITITIEFHEAIELATKLVQLIFVPHLCHTCATFVCVRSVYSCSENCEKRLLNSSCLSVCPSARFPLDGFL